ncbi:hypothetical protein ACS0TY_023208 [Phlomoides rotata]
MILPESGKLLLAASGGDTVKLFDISLEPQNPCVLTHTPSPGLRVNSVKWNHNNLVLASAGEDGKISLWRKNGQSLWMVPAKNARGEIVESSEYISTISFSNKGSRYLCSGGTGQVVRIWDLQNKQCVKWLKGHTDTITVVKEIFYYTTLLLERTRAAELRDPNGQVLGALDYSRMSRHLLVTAGDDGSVHLWDSTGCSPKASWLKQHSAPTSAVSFSPSNDKIIASVGLDMKLYTFDSGSRKPSSCIPYEAPFSSLAFTDDGLTLAAGTSTGQVVFYDVRRKPQPITVLRAFGNPKFSNMISSLSGCHKYMLAEPQRSKPVMVNENNCTDDTVLLAGDVGDSVLMPDPLPSRTSTSLSMSSIVSGSRIPSRSGSGDLYSFPAGSASSALSLSASEETPLRSSLLMGGSLSRLHALRSYNFKDDMEVFSPIVEVQPITTPSLDKLWDDRDGPKKDTDRKPSFLFPSRRFGLSEESANDNHPIFDWKSNSSSKQKLNFLCKRHNTNRALNKAPMADYSSLQSPNNNHKKPTPFFLNLLTNFIPIRDSESITSPTSILDLKNTPNQEIKNSRGLSLGLIEALTDDPTGPNSTNPGARTVLLGSQLKIQVPPLPPSVLSPSQSPKPTSDFGIKTAQSHSGPPNLTNSGLSATEMELSEDYTCVITYGPNPKTTHIFVDCIVESCCGVVKFSESRKKDDVFENRSMCTYPSDSFLSCCCGCKKNLEQGCDIYIYRGEKAFCSEECRCREMSMEEEE